jgi:hypothetical protein
LLVARIRTHGRQRRRLTTRPAARRLAAYAACSLLGGAGAGIFGYGGLRLFQEKLGFPEVVPAILATAGALAGCVAGLRIVPRGWFPGEATPEQPVPTSQAPRPTRRPR